VEGERERGLSGENGIPRIAHNKKVLKKGRGTSPAWAESRKGPLAENNAANFGDHLK